MSEGCGVDPSVAERVCLFRDALANRIGVNRFRTWFGDATEIVVEDDAISIQVATPFAREWIRTNFRRELVDVAREVLGAEPRINVLVRNGENGVATSRSSSTSAAIATVTAPESRGADRPKMSTGPRLRGELQSFVVGPSNELAYASARRVVLEPDSAVSPVVYHSAPGLGKTHLLQGICNGLRRAQPTREWRYISGEAFTNEYIYSLQHGRIDAFRAKFRSVDVLVIDDIHFLAGKRSTQEEFLHTFNAIDACGKTVVLSSDRHPRAIADLSEALINRLIAGIVVTIDPPDQATRREILRRRAEAMQFAVPSEVLEWIADQITDNVRELEGALYKLAALAALTKDPITVAFARNGLVDEIARRPRPIDAATIERVVSLYFGVSADRLRSGARDRTVSLARGILMFLLRRHTRLSSPEIGRMLGGKNHSTVLMAKSRIEQILAADGAVAWKTSAGERQARLAELLDKLEMELRTPRS